jgi:lipopolysaccharide exporter
MRGYDADGRPKVVKGRAGVSPSLSKVVRRGALWSIATTGLLRVANVITTAIIAHILNPQAFGVYAIALTAYGIVSAIGEFGLGACLMRADLDPQLLGPTLVTFAVTTNALQAVAMAVFAKPIAGALGSTAAAGPIAVLSIAMLLSGVTAVPATQLVRDFRLDRIFVATIVGFVPSTTVLVLFALHGGGAMAYAWSMVLGTAVTGGVIVASVPRFYWPGFSPPVLRILLKFGLPIGGANIVNYVLLNGDYAIVGHAAGAKALGAYVLAFNVASWPSSLLGFVVNNVAMPAVSRVKDDPLRLQAAITKALSIMAAIVIPMSALTIALARPIVLTLYGSQWTHSTRPLMILASYGSVSIICVLFANILAGQGRATFILIVQLVWLLALVPGMLIGVRSDGITGASLAHLLVIVPIVLPLYLYGLRKTVSIVSLARVVLLAALAAGIAALAARAVASLFANPEVALTAGLVAGGLAYMAVAAPYALVLLNAQRAARLAANPVFRFYATVAHLMGLPVDRSPGRGSVSSRRGAPNYLPRHARTERSYN